MPPSGAQITGAPAGSVLTDVWDSANHLLRTSATLVLGAIADAAVTTDIPATINARLRGLVNLFAARIPAIGQQLPAASRSVVPATGAVFTVAGLVSLGMPVATRSVAVTGPITDADGQVFADASGGAVTLTLPTAVGRTGRSFVVTCVDSSGAFVTLASAGGTINGATTYQMAYRESVMLTSDGANWNIIAGYVG